VAVAVAVAVAMNLVGAGACIIKLFTVIVVTVS